MFRFLILMSMVFLLEPLYAKNLGNYGKLFSVLEQDIRQIIMKRLHAMDISGELEHHQQEIMARISEKVIHPKSLHLTTTTAPQSFTVDPSITVHQDIRDGSGTVIAAAGTRLNPFKQIRFSKTLFFYDAEDKHQVTWVKNHYQEYAHVIFILTGGDVREGYKTFGRVYFDLEGRLSHYFHLKHVPSTVHQEGLHWLIQEIGSNAN